MYTKLTITLEVERLFPPDPPLKKTIQSRIWKNNVNEDNHDKKNLRQPDKSS